MCSLLVLFYFILFAPLPPKVLKQWTLSYYSRSRSREANLVSLQHSKSLLFETNFLISLSSKKPQEKKSDSCRWTLRFAKCMAPLWGKWTVRLQRGRITRAVYFDAKTVMWCMSQSLTQTAPFIMTNVSRRQHITLPCMGICFCCFWKQVKITSLPYFFKPYLFTF